MNMATVADDQRPEPEAGNPRSSFRSYFTFGATGHSETDVVQQFSAWLQQRHNVERELSENVLEDIGNDRLVCLRNTKTSGRQLRLQWTQHRKDGAVWDTEVLAHVPAAGERGWVNLVVGSNTGVPSAVPHVFGALVDILEDPRDGAMEIFSGARAVHMSQVEDLIDAVCDQERTGLMFVAGSDGTFAYDTWLQKVNAWAWSARGMSQTYVLDPAATEKFARLVGRHHEAPPWTIRTFKPGADPATRSDGFRHRVLGSRRLGQDNDKAIEKLLARIARWQANDSPTPADVARARRALARVEASLVVDRLFAVPSRATEPLVSTDRGTPREAPDALAPQTPTVVPGMRGPGGLDGSQARDAFTEIETLRLRVTQQQDQLAAARAELERRLAEIAKLQSDHQSLQDSYREEAGERVVAEHLRVQAEDEVRWLRAELKKAMAFEVAAQPLPRERETDLPDDFEELVERLPSLDELGVCFTGDPKITRNLAPLDTSGKIALFTWETLLVLTDYVAAYRNGDCSIGLHTYLKDTPSGYRTGERNKYASTESDSTKAQYGQLREFRVPQAVDPSGCCQMWAHFKLGKVGIKSPRLHLFDDLANTGKVYVGYIGPHLRTRETN
ncbi:MAG: hypothetical protein U0Q15_06940 [Kineosporiaceae bacterium]